MHAQGHIAPLACLGVFAIFESVAFNIDTTNPKIYEGDGTGYFGYKVLQFKAGKNKGVVVTAPLRQNGSGEIFSYVQTKTQRFSPQGTLPPLPATASVKHCGLTLATDATQSDFTICSPSLAHKCYENSYLNSLCYQVDGELRPLSTFTPSFQECTKKPVDLVFLFDGSGSMGLEDFEKNKEFITDVMESLKNSSIQFAAVQFSLTASLVFDFNDYQNGKAHDLLKKEIHMMDLTNTYQALDFLLKNVFENEKAGATPDAINVLLIITDGDPSDADKQGIVRTYDGKHITRFVIGVKNVALDNLYAIASEPKTNNTFHIENYDGLEGTLTNFEKKIFNIEGSKEALAVNLTNEMSQSGFSAVYHKGTLLLGSVGSNDWAGSLLELDDVHSEGSTIEDPTMKQSSYMGYSVAAGEKNNTSLYFSGAPRFEHTGLVALFRKEANGAWGVTQRVNGEQIGSYFGAELCTVDVDSDGDTDFLLVGAPLLHAPQEKREGQVYVYSLTPQLNLHSKLNVSVPSRGRFGSTIALLGDLNGDGLRDVAVGAPLEDGNSGAVYIYLGARHSGIRKTFCQRIAAGTIRPRLQFFGQAVDGHMDLGDDGLTDIVVGSRGAAVVLKSRPVVGVSTHLRFDPGEISTVNIDCLAGKDSALPMVTLTACFDVTVLTRSTTGTSSAGLNISYTLDLDHVRQTSRGFFSETAQRKASWDVGLRNGRSCFNHSISMPKCVEDTLSPVNSRLTFSQRDSATAPAILNVDSVPQADVEVPFEKNCRTNHTCVAELGVDFNFTTPTLVVVNQNYFNVTLTLSNRGDDSYNTSLTLTYPPGLSFSMMHLVEATRPVLHRCHDLEGVMDKTTCGVSLPVYRSGSTATFKTLFRIMNTYDWKDTMNMSIIGESDNNNGTAVVSANSIPVQFEMDLAVRVTEDTVTYLNFTLEDSAPKRVVNIYEVRNLGFKALDVNVSIIVPTPLEGIFEINNYQVLVQQNKTQCGATNKTSDRCSSFKSCKILECETFLLEKYSTSQFVLTAEIAFRDLRQMKKERTLPSRFTGNREEVVVKSFMEVAYDQKRYVQARSNQVNEAGSAGFPHAETYVQVELIVAPDIMLIAATGGGGGLLFLILITLVMFKMGCFKRKTRAYYQEQEAEADEDVSETAQGGSDVRAEAESLVRPSQSDIKSSEDGESKSLLQDPDPSSQINADDGGTRPNESPDSLADHYAKVI